MALTDESTGNGFFMPVAPAYGGNNNGFFGGDWAWILLLLLIGGGGWGFGGGFGGGWGMDGLYPWLNNSQNINGGFRDQMLNTQISSIGDKITSGFGDVATQLCGGFAGVNAGIANAAAQAEISANSRQMASMNQMFGLQSSLQQCCCDNRAGLADVKYTIATENCADRAALSDGIRDVLAATQAQTQTVIDKLCALELDNYKNQLAAAQRDNAALQNQVILATERADRTAQTGTIIDGVYNRLATCPVDTTPVYGRQPIFQCPVNVNGNSGCGCSGNTFFN